MLRRVLLSLCLLTMSVAGLTVTDATPASAGLSPLAGRVCKNFDSSNNRRLSICARGWVPNDGAYQWRGVVEMHTYIWVAGHPDGPEVAVDYRQPGDLLADECKRSGNHPRRYRFRPGFRLRQCRVNSPTSSQITCSVPNTYRVAFYSKAWNGVAQGLKMDIYKVSWRDDAGQPHIVQSGSPESSRPTPTAFRMVTPNTELSVDLRCRAQLPRAGEG